MRSVLHEPVWMKEASYTALSTYIAFYDAKLRQQGFPPLSIGSRIASFAQPNNEDKRKESEEEINDRCHPLQCPARQTPHRGRGQPISRLDSATEALTRRTRLTVAKTLD